MNIYDTCTGMHVHFDGAEFALTADHIQTLRITQNKAEALDTWLHAAVASHTLKQIALYSLQPVW